MGRQGIGGPLLLLFFFFFSSFTSFSLTGRPRVAVPSPPSDEWGPVVIGCGIWCGQDDPVRLCSCGRVCVVCVVRPRACAGTRAPGRDVAVVSAATAPRCHRDVTVARHGAQGQGKAGLGWKGYVG